jgi:hypothetical protein
MRQTRQNDCGSLQILSNHLPKRLRTLQTKHRPWVDIIYHNTPQYPHGVKGEFHLLMLPPDIMRRYCARDLIITYEVFWFDHPDWVRAKPRS